MKALFIGGVADGQWRDVKPGQRHVSILAGEEPLAAPHPNQIKSFRTGAMVLERRDDYTAQMFGGPTQQTQVFILDSLGVDGAMAMLLAFYRRANVLVKEDRES
jgi:hypothetical protein